MGDLNGGYGHGEDQEASLISWYIHPLLYLLDTQTHTNYLNSCWLQGSLTSKKYSPEEKSCDILNLGLIHEFCCFNQAVWTSRTVFGRKITDTTTQRIQYNKGKANDSRNCNT